MRYLLTRYVPPFERLLLVESGSREIFDRLIPTLYSVHGDGLSIDLVTCYPGLPRGFRPEQGRVFRVTDCTTAEARKAMLAEIGAQQYGNVGILCSDEPIMTKWKWLLAVRTRAKLFIINENCDYFFVDHANWPTMRHFVSYRAGFSGAEAAPAIASALTFPFTLLYLVLYAAWVHGRRALRRATPARA